MGDLRSRAAVVLAVAAMAVGLTASAAKAIGGGRAMTTQEMAETTGTVCCWNTYSFRCSTAVVHKACTGCVIGEQGEESPDGCMTYYFSDPPYTDIEETTATFTICGSDVGTALVYCDEGTEEIECYKQYSCISATAAVTGVCWSNYNDNCGPAKPGVPAEDNCYKCNQQEELEPITYYSDTCPGGTIN